jgi:branched-chain amino acid transport system ATP-binding protein
MKEAPRMAEAIAETGPNAADVLLSVEGLEAGYGEVQVLWGLSLKARRGKLTAIVGANGAGKTTTLRAVAGTLNPWGGRVMLDGEDVTRVPSHVKAARGLALVPEGRQLFSMMSVAENLELGAFSPRASRSYAERLAQVLALFPRLAERSRQRAGTLSGGEQQMVAIARGLMSDPQILIIDELSLGLAPVVVYQLLATLKQLKQNGLTILLVEQNVHLALAVSDYAYVVAEGRIFTEGLPAQLTANPEIRRAYLGL